MVSIKTNRVLSTNKITIDEFGDDFYKDHLQFPIVEFIRKILFPLILPSFNPTMYGNSDGNLRKCNLFFFLTLFCF